MDERISAEQALRLYLGSADDPGGPALRSSRGAWCSIARALVRACVPDTMQRMLRRSLLASLGALGPAVALSSEPAAAFGGLGPRFAAPFAMPTLLALRDLHPDSLVAGATALVSGARSPLDGRGGVYVWDPASTVGADGVAAVASAARNDGRWLRFIDAARLFASQYSDLADRRDLNPGTLADVVGDPGLHFDADDGRVVLNSGTYLLTASGWQRQGNLGIPYASLAAGQGDVRSLKDYLPAERRSAALNGSDKTTDHAPYLQAMLDDGWESIDLGAGTFNLHTPLKVRKSTRWIGRDAATVLRSTIDGFIVDASANGQRLALERMTIEGDLALSRGGGFRLYDPATFNVERVAFRNFSRAALRFVQGVSISVIDSTFVNCGKAPGEAGIHFDPGKTATVLPIIERCYIAACGIGVKADLARALRMDSTVVETCKLGTEFSRVDGLLSNCWFEANETDGKWSDCSGLQRIKVTSTNGLDGRWTISWAGSAASERGTQIDEATFAEMRNVSPRRVGAAGRWEDIAFDTEGPAFRAIPRAGGEPVIQAYGTGVHSFDYRVVVTNAASRHARVAVRVVATQASKFAELRGSYLCQTVGSGETATLSGSIRAQIAIGAKIKLQWTVDDVALTLNAPSTGLAAPGEATNAQLAIRHLDVILS